MRQCSEDYVLGDLGGYLYNAQANDSSKTIKVTLLLFANATITEKVAGQDITIRTTTAWPLDGKVAVEVSAPADIKVDLLVRVPAWAADSWTVCSLLSRALYISQH